MSTLNIIQLVMGVVGLLVGIGLFFWCKGYVKSEWSLFKSHTFTLHAVMIALVWALMVGGILRSRGFLTIGPAMATGEEVDDEVIEHAINILEKSNPGKTIEFVAKKK